MDLLCIDAGTYSVKFLLFKFERKQLLLENFQEILVPEEPQDEEKTSPFSIGQQELIKSFIENNGFEGKLIFQFPTNMITSRYLTIPIANRKKAEAMIPFQLEEDLPFPITNVHFTSDLIKKAGVYTASVNIASLESFDRFFNAIKSKNILPNVLSSETSIYQNYIKQNKTVGPVCFLDIGHSSTKAYFVHREQIVANHISFIAGKTITNTIAHTYQISEDEAREYKHENCFFLTEDQYENVDHDQQEFAKLMKQTMSPLLSDIRRWIIGFRARFALPIEKIYISGGTTKINNIDNFMAAALSTKIEPLRLEKFKKAIDFQVSPKERSTYAVAEMMSLSQRSKYPLANFLTGNYTANLSNSIPVHSTFFVAARVLIISIIIILSLITERVFLNTSNKKLGKKVTTLLKGPQLGITAKQRRKFKKRPQTIVKLLKKKNRELQKDIDSMEATSSIDAVSSLASLSQVVSINPNINLEYFSDGEEDSIVAKFSSKKSINLEELMKQLKASTLQNLDMDYDEKTKLLTVKYEGK